MPDVLYLDVATARSYVESAGLIFKITQRRVTYPTPPGLVVSQTPEGYDSVFPGTRVLVTVSKAPKCDPAYPDFCLRPFLPDLNCDDIPWHDFHVAQPWDPHGFDGNDNDGWGCET